MQDYLRTNDHFFTDFQSKIYATGNEMPSSTDSQESPENAYNDDLSSYSGSHPSTKCSPEYSYPAETDKSGKNSKIPPIIRKGIHKYYEPIRDGTTVFKYEENPNEYKKARKRIQNRESATRVRNRKKNYVEELEDEMNIIRAQQTEIQSKFSQVQQENNFLKQQLFFLQKKLGMQQQQPQENFFYQPQPQVQPIQQVQNQPIQQIQHVQNHDFIGSFDENYSVPVHRNIQQQPISHHQPIYEQPRYDPHYEEVHHYEPPKQEFFMRTLPRNVKTHTALLGVVTMIICMSFIGRAAVGMEPRPTATTFISVDSAEATPKTTKDTNHFNPSHHWNNVLDFMMRLVNEFSKGIFSLPTTAQYVFGALYLGYAIYVLVMINWAYLTKVSKKQ